MIKLPGICTFLFVLCVTAIAHAHDARPLYIHAIETGEDKITISWKTPPSVPQNQTPTIILEAPCLLNAGRNTNASVKGLAYYTCPKGLAEKTISISYPLYNPSLSTLVRATFLNGETRSIVLEPNISEWRMPAQSAPLNVAKSYFVIGIEHIFGGLDHLLFVGCLVYIARTPRRIVMTVTGFTIAHSITLFLVALGVIHVSVAAVETIIALSIVFLAAEIVRDNRATLTWRRPILVATGFGLAHGAGFAAGLTEFGLPQKEIITAVLFFNIGVEAGQLIVVAVSLIGATVISRLATQTSQHAALKLARLYTVYGIGIISTIWFYQRITAALT